MENLLVTKPMRLLRLVYKRFWMHFYNLIFMGFPLRCLLLHKEAVGVGLPLKFTKEAASLRQLDVGALLMLTVEIFVDLC